MGVLWSTDKQHGWALAPRTMLGRGPECSARLDDPLASANHALLTWREDGWVLRDLGSRNGTFHNNQRVEAGLPVQLAVGARLRFGGQTLHFASGGAPGPVGVRLSDSAIVEAAGGLLVLPSEEEPQAVIYEDHDGHWVLEQGDAQEELACGRRLLLSGALWAVLLPPSAATTPVPTTMALSQRGDVGGVGLHFRVSQDEEHVNVELRAQGRVTALRPRVHLFLLLQLARARLADRAQGEVEAEQGWVYVDDLCRQLSVSASVMNVQLLRARQQLAKAGVEGAGQLFERRRLSGQLRLACRDLQVSKP